MPASPSRDLAAVSFGEDDRKLFLVDDRSLRADALKFSLLPKLEVVLREAIGTIREIYDVEALEDSGIFRSPAFRTKRQG